MEKISLWVEKSLAVNYSTCSSVSWILSSEQIFQTIFFYLVTCCIRLWQVLKRENPDKKKKKLPKFTSTMYSIKEQNLFSVLLVENKGYYLKSLPEMKIYVYSFCPYWVQQASEKIQCLSYQSRSNWNCVQIFFELSTFLRKKMRE